MHDSACMWLIVKNAKISKLNVIEFSHVKEIAEP